MAEPFTQLAEKKAGFLQSLLKKSPKFNLFIRVNNLLAEAPSVRNIEPEKVQEIALSLKARIGLDFESDFNQMYARYVAHCLSKDFLTAEDDENIQHLQGILKVKKHIAEDVHERIAGTHFRDQVNEAVADGFLTNDEKKYLNKVKHDLRISEELARRIYADSAGAALKGFWELAVADQKLSPEEETELARMAKSLDVNVQYAGGTKESLDLFRKFWLISEGQLPVVETGLNLQKNESCHFAAQVNFHEMRKVTKRVTYGGYATSFKVMKGLYLRSGSVQVHRESQDQLVKIDSGTLYLTNKRIIFMGTQKNVTIRISSILSGANYSDGIEIEKGSGKNPFFLFTKDIPLFVKMLEFLMRQC